MPYRLFKNVIMIVVVALLSTACATETNPSKMVAFPSDGIAVGAEHPLAYALVVGNVTGGEDGDAIDSARLSNASLAGALTGSLHSHGFLALNKAGGAYALNAQLVKFDEPISGTTFKTSVIIQYSLSNIQTGEVVWEQTFTSMGIATMWDSLNVLKRHRIAKEFAIRNNIRLLLDVIDGPEV